MNYSYFRTFLSLHTVTFSDPGSKFFHPGYRDKKRFRILDLGSASKNLSIFNSKNCPQWKTVFRIWPFILPEKVPQPFIRVDNFTHPLVLRVCCITIQLSTLNKQSRKMQVKNKQAPAWACPRQRRCSCCWSPCRGQWPPICRGRRGFHTTALTPENDTHSSPVSSTHGPQQHDLDGLDEFCYGLDFVRENFTLNNCSIRRKDQGWTGSPILA